MKSDIVYGTKDEETTCGQFVEIFMFDEDNLLNIKWEDNGNGEIFSFLIRDKNDYENFRDELMAVLVDCKDIGEAYFALEVYLNSEYADDFLEEYKF